MPMAKKPQALHLYEARVFLPFVGDQMRRTQAANIRVAIRNVGFVLWKKFGKELGRGRAYFNAAAAQAIRLVEENVGLATRKPKQLGLFTRKKRGE